MANIAPEDFVGILAAVPFVDALTSILDPGEVRLYAQICEERANDLEDGTPKGASRSMPKSIDPIASLLSVIPLKAREKTMLAAPLFHAWGFAHLSIAQALGSTVVVRRRFDLGDRLDDVERVARDVDQSQWDAPELRQLLERVLLKKLVAGFSASLMRVVLTMSRSPVTETARSPPTRSTARRSRSARR